MTDKEKLDHVLAQLKKAALVDEKTHNDEFWMKMEVMGDNATDCLYEYDGFIKQLITYIES